MEYVSKISPCGGGGGASEEFFVLFCLLYEKLSKDRHHLPAQTRSVNDAGPGEWWTREAAAGFAARADVLNESHDHVTVCSGDFLLITTFFPLLFYLCYILRFLADWNFSTNAFGAFFSFLTTTNTHGMMLFQYLKWRAPEAFCTPMLFGGWLGPFTFMSLK